MEPCVVAGVQLYIGDRLEPTADIVDVARFETTPPPFSAVFWRMSKDDRVSHESPLYSIEGVFADSHCIDTMHCWHLGRFLQYIALVLRFVTSSNVFFM